MVRAAESNKISQKDNKQAYLTDVFWERCFQKSINAGCGHSCCVSEILFEMVHIFKHIS